MKSEKFLFQIACNRKAKKGGRNFRNYEKENFLRTKNYIPCHFGTLLLCFVMRVMAKGNFPCQVKPFRSSS